MTEKPGLGPPRGIVAGVLALLFVVSSGCGQLAPGREGESSSDGIRERPTAATILTIAIQGEPESFLTSGPGSGSGGENNVPPLVQNTLVVEDDKGVWQPFLAAEQLSVERGTWRLHPDGTMDTVWKLRPDVLWHDGTPFTSADMLLTFDIYTDPSASNPGTVRPFMRSATAPDPHTFIIHWSTIRFDADRSGLVISGPAPRHLVGEAFSRGDRVAFEALPQFTTEFVGLGPYRVIDWERGSHMELARFDRYYQGRPALDGIVLRFMTDANAMVSSILAGAVDVVLPVGVDLDAAVEVQRRWTGTDNRVQFDVSSRLVYLELQNRADIAIPRSGLVSTAVRQGFLQAIDRSSLAEITTYGVAPVAESWILPTDALYADVETWIPRFPYDPARAEQLLSQAGWVRDVTGSLVNRENGEAFRTELWGSPGEAASPEKSLSVIAQNWRDLGAQADLNIVASARLRDREYRASHPGPLLTAGASQRFSLNSLHSNQIPTAANRWGGFNRGGYNNPRVDSILDLLNMTITPAERTPLHRQLLQEQMGDVAIMPLYWEVVPTLLAKGVRGPVFYRNTASWNVMHWRKA